MNLFTIWITAQLILIGIAGARVNNEILDKKFNCNTRYTHVSWYIGALVPLAWFISEIPEIDAYCKGK